MLKVLWKYLLVGALGSIGIPQLPHVGDSPGFRSYLFVFYFALFAFNGVIYIANKADAPAPGLSLLALLLVASSTTMLFDGLSSATMWGLAGPIGIALEAVSELVFAS